MMLAASVFESNSPSLTFTLKVGAVSSPSSTNTTSLAASCALLKLVTGRGRQVHWLIYVFSILFILKYVIS